MLLLQFHTESLFSGLGWYLVKSLGIFGAYIKRVFQKNFNSKCVFLPCLNLGRRGSQDTISSKIGVTLMQSVLLVHLEWKCIEKFSSYLHFLDHFKHKDVKIEGASNNL